MKNKMWIGIGVLVTVIAGGIFFSTFYLNKPVNGSETNIVNEIEKERKIINGQYENLQVSHDIPTDHKWLFSFDKEIDETSLYNNQIYISNSLRNTINIKSTLLNNGKTIQIEPASGKYNEGETYQLVINDSIKYKDGTQLSSFYFEEFTTAGQDVEKAVRNKEIVMVSSEDLKSVRGDASLTFSKSVKKRLNRGDLIIIPSDENPDGKALKIESVKETLSTYDVTVSEPYFAELFEEMDIFKTYPITSEHIEIEDIQGMTLSPYKEERLNTVTSKTIGEFQKPEIKKENNGFQFEFSKVAIGSGPSKAELNGKLKINDLKVIVHTRSDLSGIKKLNVDVKNRAESQLTITAGKQSEKIEGTLKLGKVKIETSVPGVLLEGTLSLNYKSMNQSESLIYFTFDNENSVRYDGENLYSMNHVKNDIGFVRSKESKAEGAAGTSTLFNITAYTVEGGGVSGNVHIQSEGDGSTESCYTSSFQTTVSGEAYLDVLNKRYVEEQFADVVFPKRDYGTCIDELYIDN
ncbi:Ig-like domain-containing protein [Metabacillus idriensis]|uniref:Ig-like domain-containing protein n=1 Tax=Metabacillus idriensis TaxID=324768 RepID=UPI0028142DC2|nr:Ig-like domain-containing protein [Metabacillus idriensis]MDR0139623.1 Ig-like domain-containing protein [Metabacillus idriensis]